MLSSTRMAGNGIAFLIGAGGMAEFIAKACSSPQTLETNAGKRAPTMWKWVILGLVEGALLIGIAAAVDKQYAQYIIYGGAAEALITFAEYAYAKQSGLASPEQGT